MILHAAVALVVAGALELQPPHRTSFAKFSGDTVEACLRDVHRTPEALVPYARLNRLALNLASRDRALAALEALASAPRTANRARLYQGIARLELGGREAEGLLRQAATGLEGEKERTGEAYARLHLESALRSQGRLPEASEQLARGRQLADEVGDPFLRALVDIAEGWEAYTRGDLGRARTLFDGAREVVVGGPSGFLESLAWQGTAALAVQLGQEREAVDADLARISALERDAAPTVWARAALANRVFYLANTGTYPWSEVDRLIEEARVHAIREQSPQPLWEARYLRALRLGSSEAALQEMETLFAEARVAEDGEGEVVTILHAGELRSRVHPEAPAAAESLMTEAFELSRAHGFEDEAFLALTVRALHRWRTGNVAGAETDTEAALRLHDLYRERQVEDSVRIGTQATMKHLDLLGPLVDGGHDREAFEVSERMRARVLLDRLREQRGKVQLSEDLTRRRTELRSRLVRLQSDLVDGRLAPEVRQQRSSELERAELEERALEDLLARSANVPVPRQPMGLSELQRTLAADEAVLSFVVGPEGVEGQGEMWIGPRSFVQVITARSIRTLRIPDREVLAPEVELYLGLVQARSTAEPEAAARLHGQLVARALDGLPAGVRRLVVLPFGILHALPFEALRPAPGRETLGERFAIGRAPSATTWALWRSRPQPTGRMPLLALADPGLPLQEMTSLRESAPWLEGLHLGALPGARVEAGEAARRLGAGSRVLFGADASEHALKTLPLRQWAVLHLAAHAVADDEMPVRSAVILAPGSADEDGLLQMRDVAGLDLDGMLVVLAACRTASGPVSTGEGPIGLARAFFTSGARAVVVSLWALEDSGARRFFQDFYGSLADGAPAQEALKRARQARIRAGAPAADWAGVVVLGDGDFQVVPAARRQVVVAVAALLVIGLGVLLLHTRRRRTHGPHTG